MTILFISISKVKGRNECLQRKKGEGDYEINKTNKGGGK